MKSAPCPFFDGHLPTFWLLLWRDIIVAYSAPTLHMAVSAASGKVGRSIAQDLPRQWMAKSGTITRDDVSQTHQVPSYRTNANSLLALQPLLA